MTVKKRVRRVDLILQTIVALHQQPLSELFRVFGLLESLKKRERIKREPDLRRVSIYVMNRAQAVVSAADHASSSCCLRKFQRWSHNLPRH